MANTKARPPQFEPTPSPSSPSNKPSNKLFVFAVVGIVVIGLAAIAFFVTSSSDSDSVTDSATDNATDSSDQSDSAAQDGQAVAPAEQTAPVTVEGQPLADMPGSTAITDPSNDSSIGTVAPTLIGTDFDGSEVVIGPNGNPKVIYFVAHWCPHCQREVPLVQGLIDAGEVPDNLEIYAVSTSYDQGSNPHPSDWLAGEGFTPPVLRDDEDFTALAAYGRGGFPYAVYLDADHQVIVRTAGELGEEAIIELWQTTAG